MWTLRGVPILRGCLISAGLVTIAFSPAKADWAQTLGIGQKSTNLGSAVTATSDDYDAFYTNPAGAANFEGPFVGFGIKVMDTRTLSVKQSGAVQWPSQSNVYNGIKQVPIMGQALASITQFITPPQNGVDLSPERTLPGADLALVPSGAGYMPVPGMKNVVVGVGTGSPFLVSAYYGHANTPGNYGKFDTTSAGLAIIETSPTIAVKVNDRLNVGASMGITTLKYVQIGSELGAPNVTIANKTIPLGAGSLGKMNIQSDNNIEIPGLQPAFATSPTDVSFTLGMQYKVTPSLTGGVTYRSKTPETFVGTATADINQIGVDTAPIIGIGKLSSSLNQYLSIGPYSFKDRFKYELELPAHIQAGLAYAVTPRWKVMGDVRWTNWSDAKGFGTPTTIQLMNGTIDPGGAITQQACTLRKLTNCSVVGTALGLAGVKSAPIHSITVNYAAEDTLSLHLGTSYKLWDNLEI